MALKRKTYVSTSNIELKKRVEVVAELLIRGYSRANIIKICNNPDGKFNWNLEHRTIDNYMRSARKSFAINGKGSKKDFTNLAITRYNDLYQKNYSAEDFKECRGVQDSLNKLLGVNEPEKVDMDVKLKGSVSIKDWIKLNITK